MATKRLISTLCIIFLGIASGFFIEQPGVQAAAPDTSARNAPQGTASCQEILNRALETLHNTCDQIGRNKACYGNDNIRAELKNAVQFSHMGDNVPIQAIKTLTTSPLDVANGTWGLSLLKLQVNLPDTMPGQNVTFLVYGNTSVENTSGDMQSFYFSSGLGSPSCKEAPQDAIVVRSPNHAEVTFNANGVQITIASTIVLRATRHQAMSVELVEGHARVSADGGSQVLKPGQMVSVPMGGSDGLQPAGAPSSPVAAPDEPPLATVLNSMPSVAAVDIPINLSLEGCITRVEGDHVVIMGHNIKIDANNPLLSNAKAGDCLHIDGALQQESDGSVVIAPVIVRTHPQVNINTGKQGGDDTPGSNAGNHNQNHNNQNGNDQNNGNTPPANNPSNDQGNRGNDNGNQDGKDHGNNGNGDMGGGGGDMGDKGGMGDH